MADPREDEVPIVRAIEAGEEEAARPEPRPRRLVVPYRLVDESGSPVSSRLSLRIQGRGGNTWYHPQRAGHKCFIAFLLCLVGFGSHFCFDNPAALQKDIINVMNVSNTEFEMLYSLYSWPNVFVPIIGGYIIDRIAGIQHATIFYAIILVLGKNFEDNARFVLSRMA